jgi:hypothetical protein
LSTASRCTLVKSFALQWYPLVGNVRLESFGHLVFSVHPQFFNPACELELNPPVERIEDIARVDQVAVLLPEGVLKEAPEHSLAVALDALDDRAPLEFMAR